MRNYKYITHALRMMVAQLRENANRHFGKHREGFQYQISSLKFKYKSVQDQGSNNDQNFALEDGLPTVWTRKNKHIIIAKSLKNT